MLGASRKAKGWLTIATALVFAVGVVLAALPAAAEKKEVVIGVSIALSGNYSKSGALTLRGYKMWAKDINSRGGLLGRRVVLKVYDDKSDPTTGAKLTEKLITQDKVDLILGPYSSPVTFASSTVAEKYGFPMIAGGSSSPKPFRRGFRYLFQVMRHNTDALLGVVTLVAERGAKTVAAMHQNTIFTTTLIRSAVKHAKAKGLKVMFVDKYPKGTSDFSSILIRMKALNPDVILVGGYYPDGVAILKQIKELDINPKHLSITLAAGYDEFGETLGSDAEDISTYTGWERYFNTPGNKEFVEYYHRLYGKARRIDSHVAYGWVAAKVLEKAANMAGSLDREKIRDAMERLRLRSIMPGEYQVEKGGLQVGHEWVAIQWQKGRKEVVWPPEVATSTFVYPTKSWKER